MRIAFFTPRSIEPLHPRLRAYHSYFISTGHSVDYINESKPSSLASRINWLSLGFFDNYAIRKSKSRLSPYDLVIVTDLRYLPLARLAKLLGKLVFYETIDFNVYLRLYWLDRKLPVLQPFRNWLLSRFSRLEKEYAQNDCDEILVNSNALAAYFGTKATTLFYTSPFEEIKIGNDPGKPIALIYLGAFIIEKGADDVLTLRRQLNIPLFIFGEADLSVLTHIQTEPAIHHSPRISSDALKQQLEKLLSSYYLMGFSLIRPAHYSYEVQEANKDIDYLSMGIPLIGNTRRPTQEKVEAGCGINFQDPDLVARVNDSKQREDWTNTCRAYYSSHYAASVFNATLDNVMSRHSATSQ